MGGRGIPSCIVQKEVKRKSELERVRGTLKVAELQNDDVLKGCVAISLYDSKPVYLLSSAVKKFIGRKLIGNFGIQMRIKWLMHHFLG